MVLLLGEDLKHFPQSEALWDESNQLKESCILYEYSPVKMETFPGYNMLEYQGEETNKCEDFEILNLYLALNEETLVRKANEDSDFLKQFKALQDYYEWLLDLLLIAKGLDKHELIKDRFVDELKNMVIKYSEK